MNDDNQAVTSADGTVIGYEAIGDGPVMVAVHGGTADRTRWAAVAPLLERRFTLWRVDRRGRGLSGDAASYAVQREGEDVVALLEAAGPGAVLLAHSYGATCALAAAGRLPRVAAIVLYEPALATPGHTILDEEGVAEVERLIAAEERDEALTVFFRRVIGLSDPAIDAMRPTPLWAARMAAVHTLPREGRAAQAFELDHDALAELSCPVLVMRGSESPDWLKSAAAAVHAAIPGSAFVELDGQAHLAMDTAPDTFAREVLGFLDRVGAGSAAAGA